ncbi:MAG: peptidylprolyl isomerase [Magnetococcales bacterium]|nr:peptidylprolyl isomerase [Magnetococcales bacterium]
MAFHRKLAIFAFLGGLAPFFAGAVVLDRIVAVVGAEIVSEKPVKSQIIMASEVDEMARPLLARVGQGDDADAGRIRAKVLEELIMRVLREQKAEQLGVAVEEKDIEAVMVQVERNNNLPPGSLPKALASQNIPLAQYKLGLRDQLMKGRLINKVIRPLVSVSPDEIASLYHTMRGADAPQEVHLAQILLAVDNSANQARAEEKTKLAHELIGRLRSGASLASLAGQYSDDASGLQGGDIGWFKRGELMPELEAAVFKMQPGEFVGPVRTAQGIHILAVLEKRRATLKPKGGPEQVKVKARHILIKVPSGVSAKEEEQAKQTLLAVRQEVLAGAPFAQMARKYSQDETAREGGDLKWFGPGLMVAPFEEVAFRLKPNEVSDPVRTPFGWHLILVEERKVLEPDSLEAQSKELEERLMEVKLQARYNQWLRDIRLRAYVELR